MENKTLPTKEQYFQGKRIVITGGAGGIGSALTNMFSGIGAEVIILDVTDIDKPEKEETNRSHYAVDVSNKDNLTATATNLDEVDILIIAAGATSQTNEPTQEEMDRMKRVNVDGVQNTLSAFESRMKKGSQIVFIGTDNPPKDFYRETKEEDRRIVSSFAQEHPDFNVRTILLGPVRTPLFKLGKPPEAIQQIAENVGMYEPSEFAEALSDLLMKPQSTPYQEEKMYRPLE